MQDWLDLDAAFSSGSGDEEFGNNLYMPALDHFSDTEEPPQQKVTVKSSRPPKPISKPNLQLTKTQEHMLTDKDSLYRKLYNRSLLFFLWVIEQEKPPYVFKLHVQALTLKELSIPQVRTSIEIYLKQPAKVSVQFFAKKK